MKLGSKTTRFQQATFTVETFLDQARIDDTPERRALEQRLIEGLSSSPARFDAVVFDQGRVIAYLKGAAVLSTAFEGTHPTRTLWCNDRRLSLMDGQAFRSGAPWVFLGVAGLATVAAAQSLPGQEEEEARRNASSSSGGTSSNNNNNNNNNNG